jgi:hypothetical protein
MSNTTPVKPSAHITLHSAGDCLHIARVSIANLKKSATHKLFIVDVSGSMGKSASVIVNEILPAVVPPDEVVDVILFSDRQNHYECISINLKNIKVTQGSTFMGDIPDRCVAFIQKYPESQIVIITDGDVNDREEVFARSAMIKSKIPISASVQVLPIRFCNSNIANPDTKAVMSIGMMSTSLVEPVDTWTIEEITVKLVSFLAQGGCLTKLCASVPCLRRFPGDDLQKELYIKNGDVFFVGCSLSEINLSLHKIEENIDLSVDFCDLSSEDEIRPLLTLIHNRMRINAVMNQPSQHLFEFVDRLSAYMNQKESVVADPNVKPSTLLRLEVIKQQLTRSSKSLLSKMAQLKNEDRVTQFNSQQQASFLRGDDHSRATKDLAKRQATQNVDIDFTNSIRREICNLKLSGKNIPVLSENSKAELTASFYSTETMFDVLQTICSSDANVLNQMSLENMLTLLGGTGLAFRSSVRTLADPWIFRMEEIYLDCFLSQSDLCAAKIQAGAGIPILTPGTKKPITGVVPVALSKVDELLLSFYTQACPSLNRIHSSVAMMGLASELPFSDLALQASALLALAYQIQRSSCTSREFQFLKSLLATVIRTTTTQGASYFADLRKNLKPEYFTGENNITGVLKPMLIWLLNPTTELIPELVRLELRWRVKSRAKYLKVDDDTTMIAKLVGIAAENNTNVQALFTPEPSDVYFHDQVDWDGLKERTSEWRCGFHSSSPYVLFENLYRLTQSSTVEEFRGSVGGGGGSGGSVDVFGFDLSMSYLIVDVFNTPKIVNNGKIAPLLQTDPEIQTYFRDIVRNHHRSLYENQLCSKEAEEKKLTRERNLIELQEAKTVDLFVNLLRERSFTPHDADVLSVLVENTCVERQMKLWTFIVGRDFNDNNVVLWNDGHMLRLSPKILKSLQEKFDSEHWTRLMDVKRTCRTHIYRDGDRNRHGFSNDCPSYWALGFETPDEMKASLSEEEWKIYVQKCIANNIKKTYLVLH